MNLKMASLIIKNLRKSRFGGAMREFVRGILSPRERVGVRGNRASVRRRWRYWPDGLMIVCPECWWKKTCAGSVRLVNCAFWGPARQSVVSHGRSFISLSDCYRSSSGREKNPGAFLVEADGGKLQVRGCSFGSDEPSIALRKGLQHAIITENNGVRGVQILNEIGDRGIVSLNEPEVSN